MSPGQVSRRDFWALLAGGLAAPHAALAAAVEFNTNSDSRLRANDGPYQPPAQLKMVADIYRRMTAAVSVNGAGPFAFVVDTGANQSVISQELANQLALPDGPPAALNGVAGVQVAPTTLASLSFGGRTTGDAPLSILPQSAIGGSGMLGLDRLDGDQLILDFGRQTLSIQSGERRLNNAADMTLKARRRDGQLTLVDVVLANIPLTAFIDSGAQSTIGNMALRSRAIGDNPRFPLMATPIISATGQTISAEMANLPNLRVGGLALPNWPVAFADLHTFKMWDLTQKPAILLGIDVLSRFQAVCLDFARDEVRFRRPQGMI
jgi:predicted aspartyl protease